MAQINPSKSELEHVDLAGLVSFLLMESIGEDGSLNLELEKEFDSVQQG